LQWTKPNPQTLLQKTEISVPYEDNTFLSLMPSVEGNLNAQMTIPEISKNRLSDVTEL
jgi:hypothetical protein